MSVTLRKRKNADGTTSLRLDIYHNGQRTIETLKHLKLPKISNAADREEYRRLLQLAEVIRTNRAAELESNNYGMVSDTGKKTIVTIWMQSYIDSYTKKDKRNLQGVLNRFSTFLQQKGAIGLTFGGITPLIIEDFIGYLEKTSKGEGAVSYYTRFKKMLKYAYRNKLMKDNILDFVERKAKGRAKKKDFLTIEEIKILANTPTESHEVKKAFLFSCLTGLRWCDVKALKKEDIAIAEKKMRIVQSKTGESVLIPLNAAALKLLGQSAETKDFIFDLPTANGANKSLKKWVSRAKIEKTITWHNARHSFGTNLIFNDVDVLTTSKLLGHTSIKHTQRYVKASEEMKRDATDKINFDL